MPHLSAQGDGAEPAAEVQESGVPLHVHDVRALVPEPGLADVALETIPRIKLFF
jgi:hypothetical protein